MTIKSRLASEISKDGFLAAKSGELKKPLSWKYYKKALELLILPPPWWIFYLLSSCKAIVLSTNASHT